MSKILFASKHQTYETQSEKGNLSKTKSKKMHCMIGC